MKLGRIAPNTYFHRFLTPQYAWQPLSGAGAARNGGRFNRPGVHALYMSDTPEVALAEYLQGTIPRPPATMAAFRIKVDFDIGDLSAGFDADDWSPEWSGWDCEWRDIARIWKQDPLSWGLGDAVRSAGHRALLFPSTKLKGGKTLVVFTPPTGPAPLIGSSEIEVHDPFGDLPIDGRSWPTRTGS